MDRIFEKLKNRYSILVFIISSVFIVFLFRLMSLTLIQGDEFRELSNNKRLKDIPITSARGEIRDRYGRLLAGNKVSFTVQLIKDELDTGDTKARNQNILKLIHILNSEGTTYNDEFPIIFNSYKYKDQDKNIDSNEDINKNKSKNKDKTVEKKAEMLPIERVSEIIVENNLIYNLLNTSMQYSDDESVPQFVTAKKAINILENEGIEIPIDVAYDENKNISFSYSKKGNTQNWKKENGISEKASPNSAILQLINNKNAKKIVMKMLNDPIVSKLAYDMLEDKGLARNIEVEPIVLKYDEEYKDTKKSLMENFRSVTMNSTASDDFINILKEKDGISEILEQTVTEKDKFDDEKEVIINPGEIMLKKFKENKIKVPIKVSVNEGSKSLTYKYKNDKEKQALLKKYNLNSNMKPIDTMIKVAEREKIQGESKKNEKSRDISVLESFIKDDKIKGIAQSTLLKIYPNPKISINEWEYTPLSDKKAWLSGIFTPSS